MPGIAQRIENTSDDENVSNTSYQNSLVGGNGKLSFNSFNGSSVAGNGFWSKHRDDVSYNQLHKFWSELTPQARQKLLRIDKQTLFEHARKNMYCSRCNGLLLEGFLQIIMYGKSLQQDAASGQYDIRPANSQTDDNLCMENAGQEDVQDPSVHPWGGLTTTRDGTLTLLDCYLCSKSLEGLQNVFDSARARERERELLYPDACGGGGRGWISQGMVGYGRGHGTRETCALHTARLSVETLVDFWSALGEETRQSLLRMKEEDFIERLMYRFDSKRFCRDCRRNVVREFKELKELKRMRKEPRCTSWFCVADTAFQYEVSRDTVQADWHQTFLDTFGTYHHFEWAIGTAEGKSDILEFENVGLSGRVQVNGLDLSGLSACYITLRAWKIDGRCNELCVKAHALRGQACVHCRLVVGDGFVTISRGESIRRFFEHAEEAEEEEDDDSMDKDGNELDGECSRPQKHAKSPELAREFLLDAATVIFKEQVEKAFREGTARQNAHSIFVCLALKLLEERVHVACKEIITLEKQVRLLEEEEKEKREEEERKERRRTKEREKKLRRKERLREKESREKKCAESNIDIVVHGGPKEEPTPCDNEGGNAVSSGDSVSETGEAIQDRPLSPDIQDDQLLTEYISSNMENHSEDSPDGEFGNTRVWNSSFPYDPFKYSRRKLKFHKDSQQDLNLKWSGRRKGGALSENGVAFSKYEARYHADGFESTRSANGYSKQPRTVSAKSSNRNGGPKLAEFQCTNNRIGDRYESHCNCNHHSEYRSRTESHVTRTGREPKYMSKLDSPLDASKPYYRGNKYTQVEGAREISGRPKAKSIAGNPSSTKKVWEPLDSQKKIVRSNLDSDRSIPKIEASESDQLPELSGATSYDQVTDTSVPIKPRDDEARDSTKPRPENCSDHDGFHVGAESQKHLKDSLAEDGDYSMTQSQQGAIDSSMSSSDNCSSCLSEGDSNSSSINPQNLESGSTSDPEESSQISELREASNCQENGFTECHRVVEDLITARDDDTKIQEHTYPQTVSLSMPTEAAAHSESGKINVSLGAQHHTVLPQMHNQSIHYPVYPAPAMGYYHPNPVSCWSAGPANGLMSFPHSNHYLFPNTFGYGLNGSTQYMQYGALQHLTPPLLDPAQLPVFPQVAQVNGVSSKEQVKVANLGGRKDVQHSMQNVVQMDQHSSDRQTVTDVEQKNGKPNKIEMEGNGFSLFHFGGPVALSTGFKADPVPRKEGFTGDTSPHLVANGTDRDHPCSKKDTVEEYNLFAASNGIQFSFF